MCPRCRSTEVRWEPTSGRGRIWSFIVPHPPLLPAFAEVAPYNVIVVELDEDPPIRFVGNLVASADGEINEIDPATIAIGEPVRVVFHQIDDVTLPRWVARPDARARRCRAYAAVLRRVYRPAVTPDLDPGPSVPVDKGRGGRGIADGRGGSRDAAQRARRRPRPAALTARSDRRDRRGPAPKPLLASAVTLTARVDLQRHLRAVGLRDVRLVRRPGRIGLDPDDRRAGSAASAAASTFVAQSCR